MNAPVSESRVVVPLSAAHAEGIRALSLEPEVAGVLAIAGPLSAEGAAEYIATAMKARDEGRAYVFVLIRGGVVSGACRLIGVLGVPRLIVGVGRAYRGQGNGLILVRHAVTFAFETLGLDRVTASGACLQLLGQLGIKSGGNALTRQEWQDFRPS